MPITTPKHVLERYGERADHFMKIYASLISPAIEAAGLVAVSPARAGTENIQAAVINDLQGADLVLADLSALNPNVFLELGIRSALDKPVCLVWDGFDPLPFDSGTLNTHRYDPRPVYELNNEIEKMAAHIEATVSKSDGRNDLWRFFGSASTTLPVAELDPEDASLHSKLDRLVDLVEHQSSREGLTSPPKLHATAEDIDAVVVAVRNVLAEADPAGVHGSHVRKICVATLGPAFQDFLHGESLSGRLSQLGVELYTDSSGNFYGRPPDGTTPLASGMS